jgi:hypothetical protein
MSARQSPRRQACLDHPLKGGKATAKNEKQTVAIGLIQSPQKGANVSSKKKAPKKKS